MSEPKRKWRHRLTLKLIAIYIGISIVGLWVVGGAMRYAFREGFRDNIKPHLEQYVRYIEEDLGNPPRLERARRLAEKLPLDIYYVGDDGEWSTTIIPFPDDDDIHYHKRRRYIDSPIRWGHREGDEIAVIPGDNYTLYFVSPDDDDDHWGPAIFLPLLVVIGFFAALYYLTQRLFRPLHTIREAVNAFGEGDLERRVTTNRKDELGQMAGSFNRMADHIQQMLDSKRQLLLAISHELRSPLTRAKLATAMLGDETQRREIDDELSEMESLVNELLETERFNSGHQALNLDTLDLVELIDTVTKSIDQPVDTDTPNSRVIALVDATRLRLVIKNLLENALKHTPTGRPIPVISLLQNPHTATITVRDCGNGIAPEHIEHLCEPFYRVDPARQRATGGYGLGLYLSRVIIEAHGGNINIISELGAGTTVSFDLPLDRV